MKTLKFYVLLIVAISFFHGNKIVNAEELASVERKNDVQKSERTFSTRLKFIEDAIEKNLVWIAKLKNKNISRLSVINAIGLKYEIRDIVEYVRELKIEIRNAVKYIKFHDDKVKRQMQLLTTDIDVLPLNETFLLKDLIENWENDLKNRQYCISHEDKDCQMDIEDLILAIMEVNDSDEIKYFWMQWMDSRGHMKKDKFIEFRKLYSKAAKLNGYQNGHEMIMRLYENENITRILDDEMKKIFPIYQQIHGHLRSFVEHNTKKENDSKLIEDYQFNKFLLQYEFRSPILLINLTAPIFLENIVKFYKSLGLVVKSNYTIVDQEGGASLFDDSFGRRELRFILSDDVTERNFIRIFAEYISALEYGNSQPFAFRKIQPRAFRLAIGNALALSALSTNYSTATGIAKLPTVEFKNPLQMSYSIVKLYNLFMKMVVPIQNSLVVAQCYQCMLLANEDDNVKCNYWENKQDLQGVKGGQRTSDYDFLAEKLTGVDEDEYEQIFATILGFQIYESLCKQSLQYNDYDPSMHLADCNFSGNKVIGEKLKKIISKSGSKKWQEHFIELIEDANAEISMSSLLRYFKPLEQWLKHENRRHDNLIGW